MGTDLKVRAYSRSSWETSIILDHRHLPFGPHDCDAALPTFGVNFGLPNDRLPGECWCGILVFCWFRLWWIVYPLVYVLESRVSEQTTWFDECEWIDHRWSWLGRRSNVWSCTSEDNVSRSANTKIVLDLISRSSVAKLCNSMLHCVERSNGRWKKRRWFWDYLWHQFERRMLLHMHYCCCLHKELLSSILF